MDSGNKDEKKKMFFHSRAVNHLREILNDYDSDINKSERKKQCECKYCSYIDTRRVVMNAFTSSHCNNCGKEIVFSNSDIDFYCIDCARELDKCKHCGVKMD